MVIMSFSIPRLTFFHLSSIRPQPRPRGACKEGAYTSFCTVNIAPNFLPFFPDSSGSGGVRAQVLSLIKSDLSRSHCYIYIRRCDTSFVSTGLPSATQDKYYAKPGLPCNPYPRYEDGRIPNSVNQYSSQLFPQGTSLPAKLRLSSTRS